MYEFEGKAIGKQEGEEVERCHGLELHDPGAHSLRLGFRCAVRGESKVNVQAPEVWKSSDVFESNFPEVVSVPDAQSGEVGELAAERAQVVVVHAGAQV